MEEIHFTIRLEPRGKGRPRFRKVGEFVQTYTDKATKEYENDIRDLSGRYAPVEPFSGPIEIETIFYKKKPKCYPKKITKWTKKPDLDNMEKALWDSFDGLFWEDDAQVISSISSKQYSDIASIEVKMYAHPKE